VSAAGTFSASSLLKNSELDENGTVLSAVPWMKIVGAKSAPMYVVGDAAAMFAGVAWPCANRPAEFCAVASGYTPMHASTFELTFGVPPVPSSSGLPLVPAASSASMPPAE
jgi:hypothetical protein